MENPDSNGHRFFGTSDNAVCQNCGRTRAYNNNFENLKCPNPQASVADGKVQKNIFDRPFNTAVFDSMRKGLLW